MILNITQIISEVMTSVPQAPSGTINPNRPLTPEEDRRQKHREKIEKIYAVGSIVRPIGSSLGYGIGSALASNALRLGLNAAAKGASFLIDKAKEIAQ